MATLQEKINGEFEEFKCTRHFREFEWTEQLFLNPLHKLAVPYLIELNDIKNYIAAPWLFLAINIEPDLIVSNQLDWQPRQQDVSFEFIVEYKNAAENCIDDTYFDSIRLKVFWPPTSNAHHEWGSKLGPQRLSYRNHCVYDCVQSILC